MKVKELRALLDKHFNEPEDQDKLVLMQIKVKVDNTETIWTSTFIREVNNISNQEHAIVILDL